MSRYGVNVQKFVVISNPEEAIEAAKSLNATEFVVKAQLHAGGRGKGTFSSGLKGGVHVTKDIEEVKFLCEQMLGHRLVTKQTPIEGILVKKVMVAQSFGEILQENYFAIVLDRNYNGPVMVASPEGGVDIEHVAMRAPEKIYKEPINLATGPKQEQTSRLARLLNFQGEQVEEAQKQMLFLYKLFLETDATQLEVNPFGLTPYGKIVCFDAKITFDDNAYFRQKFIFGMRDTGDSRENEAEKYGLNYVSLKGNIGCMVNGAGLAMATMDLIKLNGGEPANFLDLGGGVNEENVGNALKILIKDKNVSSIFLNIFGGIVNCSVVANGVLRACRFQSVIPPITLRLKGTNEMEAKRLLSQSGFNLKLFENMDEASISAIKDAYCSGNASCVI
ncbi:succinate--CoA ligase [GDP-forming] subunit beta, mitochondrial-like [Zophobas morio]|uniref:succinate--CoA ligase [GDP-forming] subunit beta, mitochondrial-like n=1 Tax=Zophobas morio TaxID=2755281 RepID=UPI0030827195